MSSPESILIKEKIPIKHLTLVLSQGDDIMDSIKQGMRENNVRNCSVYSVSGKMSGTINYMEGHRFKSTDFKEKEVLRASGTFKFGFGELWGKLNISTYGRKPLAGTLVRGSAIDGFELKLSFVD